MPHLGGWEGGGFVKSTARRRTNFSSSDLSDPVVQAGHSEAVVGQGGKQGGHRHVTHHDRVCGITQLMEDFTTII